MRRCQSLIELSVVMSVNKYERSVFTKENCISMTSLMKQYSVFNRVSAYKNLTQSKKLISYSVRIKILDISTILNFHIPIKVIGLKIKVF